MASVTGELVIHIENGVRPTFTAGAHSIGDGGWASVYMGNVAICVHADAADDLHRIAEQFAMAADAVAAEHKRRRDKEQARDNVANGTATPHEKALAAS